MSQICLSIDLERCTGCKSCEAACKQVNGLGPDEYRNKVMWLGDPSLPELDFLTVTCQQCERPACLRACPVVPKALSKDPDTGVVSVDESLCTGCGECVLACPYGAMGYDPVDNHAVKCDLCAPRRARGEMPACASVCPTRAITFGKREDLLSLAHEADKPVRDHDHFLQGPATLYLDRSQGSDSTTSKDPLADKHPPAVQGAHLSGAVPNSKWVQIPYRKVDDEQPDEIKPGGCNICFNGCTLKFGMRNGEVVQILGNDEDPVFQGRICAKSQMTLQLYRNPDRLTHPLKRRGPPGSETFERVSWDEALDDIAARLKVIRERDGSEALAIHMGTRTGVLNIMGFIPMFTQMWGTPNVLTTEPFCDASKVVALELTLGSTCQPNIYTPEDIGSAELHVYFGDNQAETRPVNFGMVNDWRLRQGAGMVVIDPRLTATASKADRWLAIRPGTDMALALGLIHEIFTQGWHDLPFCEQWVQGWEVWRDFIQDQGYTIDWASDLTGLDAELIRQLSRDIAHADGCMIFASRGINQHSNGTQANRTLMFLAAITGNWGRRGGGYFNVASEPDWGRVQIPEDHRSSVDRPALGNSPRQWLQGMLEGTPYAIRGLITGNNPAAQWPDQKRVQEAFRSLDLLVHMDLFFNETSALADYVLPAATGIEKGGISRLAEDRRIVWNDRLMEPPGEARSDHWFWIELGKRLGYQSVLQDRYKDPAVFWDEVLRQATPSLKGVTMKRLTSTPYRWVRIPVSDEAAAEPGTLYLEGSTAFGCEPGKRFPTPSGKLEFWTPTIEAKFQSLGLSSLPYFYTEAEASSGHSRVVSDECPAELSPFFHQPTLADSVSLQASTEHDGAEWDTQLVTGRPTASHFHSWTHYFWQAQEMWPDLYCQIHPDKATPQGIRDGDSMIIESPQGRLEARAWVTSGIHPDVIFIPIGWDTRQPFHPWGSVNDLTSGTLDPVSHQSNLKLHRCRVRSVQKA